MEPAAPRLDTLAPELIARVCVAGRTRELARLGAASRALRDAMRVDVLEGVRAAQAPLCAALMAALPVESVPRALWDLEAAGELVPDAEARLPPGLKSSGCGAERDRATLEEYFARARFAGPPVGGDARSSAELRADAHLREVAVAHGLRLCPGLGTMVARMIHAQTADGATPDLRGGLPIAPRGSSGNAHEHPLGVLRVSGRDGHSGYPLSRCAPPRVGDVVLWFDKGDMMMVAWHFLVGARAWLLVGVDCRPEPVLQRKPTFPPGSGLFERWLAADTVFERDAAPPPSTLEDAAQIAEMAMRALEEAHQFWATAQQTYLAPRMPSDPDPLECVHASLLDTRRRGRHLPRCYLCSRMCAAVLRCGKCKRVYYCSPEHQRASWTGSDEVAAHKDECRSAGLYEKRQARAFQDYLVAFGGVGNWRG